MFKEIYLSIFQSQMEAIDHEYIILQMFFTTRAGLKIGEYLSDISPCFSRRISSHMTCFIQSRTSDGLFDGLQSLATVCGREINYDPLNPASSQ